MIKAITWEVVLYLKKNYLDLEVKWLLLWKSWPRLRKARPDHGNVRTFQKRGCGWTSTPGEWISSDSSGTVFESSSSSTTSSYQPA